MNTGLGVRIALDTDSLARAFACARVGRGALTADREATEVADAAIALDALQTLEVHAEFAAQVTFDDILAVLNGVNDLGHLLFSQVLGAGLRFDLRYFKDVDGIGRSDAVDVAQGDVDSLVARNFNSDDTSHNIKLFLKVDLGRFRSILGRPN